MMRDMKVPIIMDYQLRLWGLYMFIQSQQLMPHSNNQLQGSTLSHLSLHTKATQWWVAFPSKILLMPNFWWDCPTPAESKLCQLWESPYSWPGWPGMVWGVCAKYPGVPVHSPNTQTSNPIPTTQSSGDAPVARINGYRQPSGPTRPH